MIRYFFDVSLFERDVAAVRANCLKCNNKFLFSQVAAMLFLKCICNGSEFQMCILNNSSWKET